MAKISVSVVMPAYNRTAYVGEAIKSVLDQTYRDFELIVVDDGSTDSTAEVVARFKDDRIKYVFQSNTGETAARNTGIAHADGELLAFLDSDDRMLPNNLKLMAGLLETRPDVDVAYGWFYMMDEDGLPINAVHGHITGQIPPQLDQPWPGVTPPLSGTTLEGQIFADLILEPEGTLAIGGAVVRRARVEAIGGFDPTRKHQGHWDFFLRLARAKCNFVCMRQGVMSVRIHPGGAHKNTMAMYTSRLNILDNLFGDPDVGETLAPIRHAAYLKTHLTYMRLLYGYSDVMNAATALNEAVKYGTLPTEDFTLVAALVAHHALMSNSIDPITFVDAALAPVNDQALSRRLRNQSLGLIRMELARRAHEVDDRYGVLGNVLHAVKHDRAYLRNRGLARMAIDSLVGRHLVDRIRKRHYSVSKELSTTVMQSVCLFISPHFDDAILSCGGTMARLARGGTRQVLLTVFTADATDESELSPLARQMHKAWGGNSHPFHMRGLEDCAVAERLGISHRWLGFHDVVYRYPDMFTVPQIFVPEFDTRSDPSYAAIRSALTASLREYPDATIFAPLGVGNHRDHLIVHEAVQEAVRDMQRVGVGDYRKRFPVYFYEDFPYAAKADVRTRLSRVGPASKPVNLVIVDITQTLDERVALTKLYASQVMPLFGSADNVRTAIASYAMRVGSRGKPAERFWVVEV